jgi:hypothetical protein
VQKNRNKLYVIPCIHLEEQTKDIIKLKSVSKYNHQGRIAKHLKLFFSGGGGGGDVGVFT